MEFRALNDREFDTIRKNFDYNFYQSSQWPRVKKNNGWTHDIVGVFQGDRPLLICLILMKKVFSRYMCYAPRGPLVAEDADREAVYAFFLQHVKKHLKKEGGFVLKFDPYIKMRERDRSGAVVSQWDNDDFVTFLKGQGCRHQGYTVGYSNDAQFRWSYGLDIRDKTEEELKKDMNYRCKRSIKKAEKYPMILVDVNEDNLEDFKEIMGHTADRHLHADRGADYYMTLISALEGQARGCMMYLERAAFLKEIEEKKYEVREDIVSRIREDDRDLIPLTAAIFIMDKKQMNYVYGGTYAWYFPLNAQYRLQMEMIRFSMEKGLDVYDFGGIPGIFDKDAEEYKIYDYKRGYGGYVIEYIGEFDLPVSPAFMALYKKILAIYKKLR